jgi:hypothetical protein
MVENKYVTPMLIILLCSVIVLSTMGIVDNKEYPSYDICDDGLSFVKLKVTPQFKSETQANFYLDVYSDIAEDCING